MGILVITWNFPPRRGGIEYLVSHLCAGLKKNHNVFVITARARAAAPSEERVFRAPWRGLIPFALYSLWRGAWLLFRNPGLRVVLGGSVIVTPLVLLLSRLFGRKAAVQAHGLDVIYASKPYRLLCSHWIKYCDRVIANSNFTAALVQQKGVWRDRIAVIPPGVDPDRFSLTVATEANKKDFGLEEKKTILFVGRLAKRKGVKEFIQHSLTRIVQEVPNVCFVVVGDNPKESLAHREDALSEIMALIGELSLERHVRLLGAVGDDDLIKLYKICDVFILPASAIADDVEGFGIVLLEAAAAERPVVATRVGGIPDAIEDGKSGILVEPGDYAGLSRSIIALLADEGTRLGMGEYARRRAQQRFRWERVIADYEAALDLAAKPGAG